MAFLLYTYFNLYTYSNKTAGSGKTQGETVKGNIILMIIGNLINEVIRQYVIIWWL